MRNPTLFDMEKLEDAAKPVSELKIERPYSLPGILLGSSVSPQTVGNTVSILPA